jgi:CRP/FNR family cyclic AMP-dependent transcriptional regulator
LGKVVNYRPGQIIIQEGQRGGNIHIVISGRAEISKAGKELNKKKYLGDIDRGSIFGEMSVFDKGPYSATVKARQDCSIHVVKGEDFKNFLKKNPDLAYGVFSTLISLMSSRLRRANSALSLTGI